MVYALNSTAQLLGAAGENEDWPDGDGTSEGETSEIEDDTAGAGEPTGDTEPPPPQIASPTGVSSM